MIERIQRVRDRPRSRPAIDIDQALLDRNLLGAALGDTYSWNRWLSVLRGAFCLPMTLTDKQAFREVANRDPPSKRVREFWAVLARRSGKSRVAAALAVYLSLFFKHDLARGEVGTVLVLAASTAQAQVVFNYCLGFLTSSPILSREVLSYNSTEIKLRNRNVISIHANSYKTVRGRTLIAAIFDEIAFWRDETSANPDVETYRAILPSLITTNGMLIGISSPYRKTGLLHQKWRDCYGVNSDDILVVQGASRQFNPTLDAAVIATATAADPEAARAEWEGEFRSDISSFLDDQTIEACVDYSRPMEIPPRQGISYRAFVDPSGGRHDHFCLAIGHREGTGSGSYYVVDVVKGRAPPFDPQSVVTEYVDLLKQYKVNQVTGDNYSGEWVQSAFTKLGIKYVRSELNKSQLYLEALPLFMRQSLSLPNHPRLIRELRLLERRTSRMGRDTVDHGANGSDDYPNSLCGLLRLLSNKFVDVSLSWVSGDGDEDVDGKQNHSAAMLTSYLRNHGIPV